MRTEKEKYRYEKKYKVKNYGIYFLKGKAMDMHRECEEDDTLKNLSMPILSRRYTSMIKASKKTEQFTNLDGVVIYNFMDKILIYADEVEDIEFYEGKELNVPRNNIFKIKFIDGDYIKDEEVKEKQLELFNAYCKNFGLKNDNTEFAETLEERRKREKLERKQRRNR